MSLAYCLEFCTCMKFPQLLRRIPYPLVDFADCRLDFMVAEPQPEFHFGRQSVLPQFNTLAQSAQSVDIHFGLCADESYIDGVFGEA
jgi:hypothetical protein